MPAAVASNEFQVIFDGRLLVEDLKGKAIGVVAWRHF